MVSTLRSRVFGDVVLTATGDERDMLACAVSSHDVCHVGIKCV